MTTAYKPPRGAGRTTLGSIILASPVASVYASLLLPGITGYRLWSHGVTDPLGLALALLFAFLTFIPLPLTVCGPTSAFIRSMCTHAASYFPMKVLLEDEESLKAGRPYILGFEPHSALPVGIPIVFAPGSPLLPKALRGAVHGMASSVCFQVPFVRTLWWWLGLRPVSRKLMDRLLDSGKSVVLNPGGVQECLYMERGSETVFLRKRHGFVRMALKHGAPLVPVFAFNQSEVYHWHRPKPDSVVRWISRKVGAVPMSIWGLWGSPQPYQVPVTVVIGRPIEVPKVAEPSTEEVDKYLALFIEHMAALFERNKDAAGCAGMELRIL